jgi:hypothetical protein
MSEAPSGNFSFGGLKFNLNTPFLKLAPIFSGTSVIYVPASLQLHFSDLFIRLRW